MTSTMSTWRSNQLSYASITGRIIPHLRAFVKGFFRNSRGNLIGLIFLGFFCAEGGERRGMPVGRALLFCHLPTPPLAYFPAPIPLTPFPAGRGKLRLFHARGFAPCIPAPEPETTQANPAEQIPGGGFPAGRRLTPPLWYPQGACLPCCLPTPPLAYFPAPIPPPALAERSSPVGKGEILVFLCKGLRPLHPRG